jgi:hypothetical protein
MHELASSDEIDQARSRFPRSLLVRVYQQDPELVASKPSDDVALAHPTREQARNLDERLIAGLVAERVVDVLQAVQIDEQHRRTLAVTLNAVDQPLERAHEAAAVGKVDEEVLMRQLIELVAALLELRDLATKQADFLNETLDVGDVGDLVRHCPRAFALACAVSHSAIPKR